MQSFKVSRPPSLAREPTKEEEDFRRRRAYIWREQLKEELAEVQRRVLAGEKIVFKEIAQPWRNA